MVYTGLSEFHVIPAWYHYVPVTFLWELGFLCLQVPPWMLNGVEVRWLRRKVHGSRQSMVWFGLQVVLSKHCDVVGLIVLLQHGSFSAMKQTRGYSVSLRTGVVALSGQAVVDLVQVSNSSGPLRNSGTVIIAHHKYLIFLPFLSSGLHTTTHSLRPLLRPPLFGSVVILLTRVLHCLFNKFCICDEVAVAVEVLFLSVNNTVDAIDPISVLQWHILPP